MASKTTQDTEIEKLYNRLLKQPEKGAIQKTFSIKDGSKVHSGYSPTLQEFKAIIHQKMNDPEMFPPGEDYSWAYKLSMIKKSYGVGPSVNYGDQRNRQYERKNIGNEQLWWQRKKAHLSPDGEYYIVPLVFENMLKNPNLSAYKDASGKIEIGTPAPKNSNLGRGLLGNQEFVEKCKIWALDKLQKDLDKEIRKDNFKEWSNKFGFLPQDIKAKRPRDQKTGSPKEVSLTQSWHIIPRQPEYQTLWIKMLFDRQWVDSLPNKSQKVDLSKVKREVLVLVKDFKEHLDNLENILLHFDAQMTIAFAKEGFETNFNAKCSASSVKEICGIIDGLLRTNSLPSLQEIKDNNPLGALQFGFTQDYVLQYVSFSEVADCLCEEGADLEPYILKEGINAIKGSGALSIPRINNFLHLLPDINRRYARYLKEGGNYSTDLFSIHQSWLDFINSYVYPLPETNYSGEAKASLASLTDPLQLKNPVFKDLLFTGKYIKDPTNLMSPDVKNLIAGASNVTNMYAGDDNLLKALTGEIKSMTELWDKLLNRIPIAELIKIASSLLFKCIGDREMKQAMCRELLKTIPISELRQQLYPCLRKLPDGELAIAKLEGMITGRVDEVYKVAMARYPDKFPKDPSESWTETQLMSKLVPLYCSDPHMQKKLGRSPGDFSDELLKWADDAADDAICDCVLSSYGPVTKLLEYAEDVTDSVVDGMTSASKDKLYENDQDGTLALDRMIEPIKNYLNSQDKMGDIKKAFAKGLKDMGMSLVYATTMVVLKYVKDQFKGSLTQDLCNSKEAFGYSNPKEWIMSSQIYKDTGENELWNKFEDLKTKHFFNQDVQTLVDGFDKLGDVFSPRELKRLFTTECGDNSFEGSYEDAALAFMDEQTIMMLQAGFPGLSLAAIAALADYDPTKKDQKYTKKDPITGAVMELPFPDGFISPTQAQAFILDLGSLIDGDIYDEAINEYDALQSALTGLCDPANVDDLADSIYDLDIIALAEADQQKAIDDALSMLPFMDNRAMENLYPPLFCGPCAPEQIGMKPLMPSQTHETQMHMQERLLTKTYGSIDNAFNNNLSVYKSIIKETFSPFVLNLLLGGISNPDMEPEEGVDGGPSAAYASAVTKMLTAAKDKSDSDKEDGKLLVAKKFRSKLLEIIESPATGTGGANLVFYDGELGIGAFEYALKESNFSISMIFNFSGNAITYRGTNVPSPQVKIISYSSGVKEYEYPSEEIVADIQEMKDFDMDDVVKGLFHYWKDSDSKGINGNIIAKMILILSAEGNVSANIFKGIFPLASNLILETVWQNASKNDLFEAKNFNSIPLTNDEAASKCLDTNPTPLLDPEKNKKDVEEVRKTLECLVSMFDTPDALQIANMFGLYKMLLKVCVVEEYFKNIFMFSFAKISDIIDDGAYMTIVKSSVRSTVESVLSSGYTHLLKYSEKVVNARRANLDLDAMVDENGEPLSAEKKAEETRVKTPEESLDILIKEVALEIDDLMDERVRKYANPEWANKFTKLEDKELFKNNLFRYAIHSELMTNTKFPFATSEDVLPEFAPIDDYSNPVHPFPSDMEGGLFFEPFIRMKSTLSYGLGYNEHDNPKSLEEADPYFQKFWNKFKEAFLHWEKAVFRDRMDHSAYGVNPMPGQFPQAKWGGSANNPSYNPISFDYYSMNWGPIYNTFFTRFDPSGASYKSTNTLYKQIIPDKGHWPLGAQESYGYSYGHTGDFETIRHIHNFIREIIGKIEKELEQTGRLIFQYDDENISTFWDFFLTFFSPVEKDGEHIPHPSAVNSIFRSVVSSFMPEETTTTTFSDNQGTAFYKAFYYWEHYSQGVSPAASPNFRNRGVMNLDTIRTTSFQTTAKKNYKSYEGSIIDLFSAAKEVNIGVNKQDLFSAAYIADTQGKGFDSVYEDSDLFMNKINMDDMLNVSDFRKIIGFMMRHDFKLFSKTPGDNDFNSEWWGDGEVANFLQSPDSNLDYVCAMHAWLKRVIVEAPFDQWFDISLGTRLNLVVPYKGQGVDSAYMENLIFQMRNLTPFLNDDVKIDRNYIQDKAFLLTNAQLTGKYLCLPVEIVEHDLRQYWEDAHKIVTTPNDSYGISNISSAFLDPSDPILKENPWTPIMSKISQLGFERTRDNFLRGENFSQESNLYNNLFVPIEYSYDWILWDENNPLDQKPEAGHSSPQLYYRNVATEENPVRPTLWAVCKLLSTSLSPDSVEKASFSQPWETDYMRNPWRTEVLNTLENALMLKMKNSDILNEILPIRQTSITTAIMYRYAMLESYPDLENLFAPTKRLVNSFIVEAIKVIDDDFSTTDAEPATQEERIATSAPDAQEIAKMFFELVIQMAANTVDPTWKSPWFFPGPLTPVGIIAKLLAQEPNKDEESAAEEECGDKSPLESKSQSNTDIGTDAEAGADATEDESNVDPPVVGVDPDANMGIPAPEFDPDDLD